MTFQGLMHVPPFEHVIMSESMGKCNNLFLLVKLVETWYSYVYINTNNISTTATVTVLEKPMLQKYLLRQQTIQGVYYVSC